VRVVVGAKQRQWGLFVVVGRRSHDEEEGGRMWTRGPIIQ
jgi:hypothetical protein